MVTTQRLEPGMTVGNEYRIARLVARGGTAAVYAAERVSDGAECALKVMHAELAQDTRQRERFFKGAELSGKVESEHVARIFNTGEDEATGRPWIAMEFLQGDDLEKVLKQRGALPLREVYWILRQVCDGVAAGHRQGVVHRDLKPQNILLVPVPCRGAPYTVKVLDFGISKVAREDGTDTTLAFGTPLWMAPEQAHKGKLTPAADVWSLGLLAFQMITGRHYWKSANESQVLLKEVLSELLMQSIDPASERARELGGVMPPEGFDAWFARAVSRTVGDRFKDAGEAFESLTPVLASAVRRTNSSSSGVSALRAPTQPALGGPSPSGTGATESPRPSKASLPPFPSPALAAEEGAREVAPADVTAPTPRATSPQQGFYLAAAVVLLVLVAAVAVLLTRR